MMLVYDENSLEKDRFKRLRCFLLDYLMHFYVTMVPRYTDS